MEIIEKGGGGEKGRRGDGEKGRRGGGGVKKWTYQDFVDVLGMTCVFLPLVITSVHLLLLTIYMGSDDCFLNGSSSVLSVAS